MSFQSNGDIETKEINQDASLTENATAFEKHIIQCCKAPEWELRKWLKKVLMRAGFEIFEDDYKSERVEKDDRYKTVHNMVAVRGKPNVCLVAHTDVCRDHEELRGEGKYGFGGEHNFWMHGRHEEEKEQPKRRQPLVVEPVIKEVLHDGKIVRVIQDKDCKVQVGGDDRLGVAIITKIALATDYDLSLYFPTDEEIGLKSARMCEMKQLKDVDLLVEVDRGNHMVDELVIKISGQTLCDYDTATRLLEIAYNIGLPRFPQVGYSTDIYALRAKDWVRNAVNLSCGYYASSGASSGEYIRVDHAQDTMKYVNEIVKCYYLNS